MWVRNWGILPDEQRQIYSGKALGSHACACQAGTTRIIISKRVHKVEWNILYKFNYQQEKCITYVICSTNKNHYHFFWKDFHYIISVKAAHAAASETSMWPCLTVTCDASASSSCLLVLARQTWPPRMPPAASRPVDRPRQVSRRHKSEGPQNPLFLLHLSCTAPPSWA